MANNRLTESMEAWENLTDEQRARMNNTFETADLGCMKTEELERMKLVLELYHGLQQLKPAQIETWRNVCLVTCSQDDSTQDFISMAADMALRPNDTLQLIPDSEIDD